MVNLKDYGVNVPDLPCLNFSAWLDAIASRWGAKTALYYRSGKQKEFTQWSFLRLAEESRRIGRGLLAAGLRRGSRVALWADNRPEWMAVWLGAAAAGLVVVPVDILFPDEECANLLRFTEAEAFFYSPRKRSFAAEFLALEGAAGGRVKAAVCLGPEEDPGFEAFGADAENQSLPAPEEIAPEDPASIVFSSGTTGYAKGITLSHQGMLLNSAAAIHALEPGPSDVFISVLPLHHTYPATCSFISPLFVGAATVIVEKLVGKVVIDDIRDARGTYLIAVPLLYDKVMAAVQQGCNALPGILRAILDPLRRKALKEARRGNSEFGRRVFGFLRAKAGLGTIKLMVAGGGALNPKTADFFDSLGFNIVHGYGMSENSPLISVNTPLRKNNISVGLPVKGTQARIVDPDEDGVGEITIRSPSIMLGYYKDPEATREAFTEEGWLKTGDLGYIDRQGFLFINGRKKNIIVSSGGKNIHPEEIEGRFDDSRVIEEILILGRKDPDRSAEQIFAVAVPNMDALKEDYPDRELDGPFLRSLVKDEIDGVNRGLPSYKKIDGFILRREPFEKNAQQKIRRFLYKSYGG